MHPGVCACKHACVHGVGMNTRMHARLPAEKGRQPNGTWRGNRPLARKPNCMRACRHAGLTGIVRVSADSGTQGHTADATKSRCVKTCTTPRVSMSVEPHACRNAGGDARKRCERMHARMHGCTQEHVHARIHESRRGSWNVCRRVPLHARTHACLNACGGSGCMSGEPFACRM